MTLTHTYVIIDRVEFLARPRPRPQPRRASLTPKPARARAQPPPLAYVPGGLILRTEKSPQHPRLKATSPPKPKPAPSPITPRQLQLINEYCRTNSITLAALAAGYSYQYAWKLLRQPAIQEAISSQRPVKRSHNRPHKRPMHRRRGWRPPSC